MGVILNFIRMIQLAILVVSIVLLFPYEGIDLRHKTGVLMLYIFIVIDMVIQLIVKLYH